MRARCNVQPDLSLTYSSNVSDGEGGYGWNLSIPSIERQPFTGWPIYDDEKDRFAFEGKPLVFICTVDSGSKDCPKDESFPPDFIGFRYYRLQVEGLFARFFLKQDGQTWLMQTKGGTVLQFGEINLITGSAGPNEPIRSKFDNTDRNEENKIFRWHLSLQKDLHGNKAIYLWQRLGGRGLSYLTHILDTPPANNQDQIQDRLADYAHHTQLTWEATGLRVTNYAHIDRAKPDVKLVRIAVSSMPTSGSGRREMIRAYNLSYFKNRGAPPNYDPQIDAPLWGHSFLKSIQQEGRCGVKEENQQIPNTTACPTLPAVTFEYEHGEIDNGFAGISSITGGRPNAADEHLLLPDVNTSAIVDLNHDGLPDVVQSWPLEVRDLNGRLILEDGAPIPSVVDKSSSIHEAYMNEGSNSTSHNFIHKCINAGALALHNLDKEPRFLSPFGASIQTGFADEVTLWSEIGYGAVFIDPDESFADKCALVTANNSKNDPHPALQWRPQHEMSFWLDLKAANVPNAPQESTENWFTDVDADGYIDLLSGGVPIEDPIDLQSSRVLFTRRNLRTEGLNIRARGALIPFQLNIADLNAAPKSKAPISTARKDTQFTYTDINGDGFTDLVMFNSFDDNGIPRVRPGDGRGVFKLEPSKEGLGSTGTSSVDSDSFIINLTEETDKHLPFTTAVTRFHDVTGDGLADIVSYDIAGKSGNVSLWVNVDGLTFRCANPKPAEKCSVGRIFDDLHGTFDLGSVRLTFADMDANGVDDLVALGTSGIWRFSVGGVAHSDSRDARAPRPGLLTRINNGYGASHSIKYKTIQELDLEARKDTAFDKPWDFHSPLVVSVVTNIKTENTDVAHRAIPRIPEPYGISRSISYKYRDPAYDVWEKRFLGFRKVRTEYSDKKAATEITYFFGECQSGAMKDCPNTSDNEPNKALIGQPISVIERSSNIPTFYDVSGTPGDREEVGLFSLTVFKDWVTQTLFSPISLVDNNPRIEREVRFSYPSSIQTYFYDPSKKVVAGGAIPIVRSDKIRPPLQAERKIMVQNINRNNQGDVTKVCDRGQVKENLQPLDQIIRIETNYSPSNSCNSNWQCLVNNTITGEGRGESCEKDSSKIDRQHRFTYDQKFGDLTDAEAFLDGVEPLDRRHEIPGASFAHEPPATASTPGWKKLMHVDYDQFGNVIRSQGGGMPAACSSYEYDPEHAQFPLAYNIHTNGCGSLSLKTTLSFDRGIEKADKIREPNGLLREINYDPFGRVSSVFVSRPDTKQILTLRTLRFTYNDSNPLNLVKVERFVGKTTPLESVIVNNALGEPVLGFENADPNVDQANWIVNSLISRDDAGRVNQFSRPWFFLGDPLTIVNTLPLIKPPAGVDTFRFHYDDIGRIDFISENGKVIFSYNYKPLSIEINDAIQLKTSGTSEKLFSRVDLDGHGRVKTTARMLHGDMLSIESQYQATGETIKIIQRHTADNEIVERSLFYDSLGRLIKNVEPNTTANGKFWRYAYDDAGHLVGTSDARGCGKNLFYDGLGRILAEDFSPCKANQPKYTEPDVTNGNGTEAFFRYDTYSAGQLAADTNFDAPQFALGNLVGIFDGGAKTQINYDIRGRQRRITRNIVVPGQLAENLNDRYSTHEFQAEIEYDLADRIVKEDTGIDVPELLDANKKSTINYEYGSNGFLKSVFSSYGPLIKDIRYDAEGLPLGINYGDVANTKASFDYDERKRLSEYFLRRESSPIWDQATPTYSLPPKSTTPNEVTRFEFKYDDVGNPIEINDLAIGDPWPVGAKPLSRTVRYDDLYRVKHIGYTYAQSDIKVSPFLSEILAGSLTPIPPQKANTRIRDQNISYDWKGNITETTDDLSLIFDRSLGGMRYAEAKGKPNQLTSAANGHVTATYDEIGNMVDLKVERSGTCQIKSQDLCSQRFVFDWNEVGQMVRGRRWDYSGNAIPSDEPKYPKVPTKLPVWDMSYAYSIGQRVSKTISNDQGKTEHSLEIFDSLRINKAKFDLNTRQYELSNQTETAYLAGIARVVFDKGTILPSPSGKPLHLLLELGDHLGSNSVVIDSETGEVVEKTTYQAQGSIESDFRPERWKAFREDYKFTGKEEDLELGITYFGARYYHPYLGRWMSADPLTVHTAGADLNPYSYVNGQLFNKVDLMGLDDSYSFPNDYITGHRSGDNALPNSQSDPFTEHFSGDPSNLPVESHTNATNPSRPRDTDLRESWPLFSYFFTVPSEYVRPYQLPPENAPIGLSAIRQLNGQPSIGVANFSRDKYPGTSAVDFTVHFVNVNAGLVGVLSAAQPLGGAAIPLETALRARADAERAVGRRGVASALEIENQIFTDTSFGRVPVGNQIRTVAPNNVQVQEALDLVPNNLKSPWHGSCGEVGCLNQAFGLGYDPYGGRIASVTISKFGNPNHGLPRAPCSSCQWILDYFGVKY